MPTENHKVLITLGHDAHASLIKIARGRSKDGKVNLSATVRAMIWEEIKRIKKSKKSSVPA